MSFSAACSAPGHFAGCPTLAAFLFLRLLIRQENSDIASPPYFRKKREKGWGTQHKIYTPLGLGGGGGGAAGFCRLERTPLFIHRAPLKGNDLQTTMEFCKR
jgi:hypothetical protein